MGDAPYIIVKNRPGAGPYKRSIRIARIWRHKETGNIVELRNVQNVVPDNYIRIVFFDPTINHELSMPLKPRPQPFQTPGSAVIEMQPSFEEQYEVHHDQRSTRV